MRTFIQDLRYGMRTMIKSPGFSIVAVLTLALGIGANTTIFSTINAFILRPMSVPNPEELVVPLWQSTKSDKIDQNFSYPDYVDIRDRNKTLFGVLAWVDTFAGISDDANSAIESKSLADFIYGEMVSANYFDVLGVKMVLGRGFRPEEDKTLNTHPVAVLSHSLWQRRYNSDGSIIGKSIYLNGSPFTVIGIAPEHFPGVKFPAKMDYFVPLSMYLRFGFKNEQMRVSRFWKSVSLLGRLKTGVSIEQAKVDLDNVVVGLTREFPKEHENSKVQLVREPNGRIPELTGFISTASIIALSVTGLVLLLACVNVANLLLSRAASRSREISIRVSVGAGRSRIIRQLLTESLLLSLTGGLVGLLLAYWGGHLISKSIPLMSYPINLNLDFNPDLLSMKWAFGISILITFIFGLIPALIASKTDLTSALKSDSGITSTFSKFNIRRVLVLAQVSLSIIILVCAGLFVRSLQAIAHIDKGFSTENLLTLQLDTLAIGLKNQESKIFYRKLLQQVVSTPGVKSASLANNLQLGVAWNKQVVMREGDPPPKSNEGIDVPFFIAGPKYFSTIKTPQVTGREFNELDNDESKGVAIVNREFARKYLGNENNAIGKRLRLDRKDAPFLEIIGVVENSKYHNFYEPTQPVVFMNQFQVHHDPQSSLLVIVDNPSNVSAVISSIRSVITKLDSRVPSFGLMFDDQVLSFAYWMPRLGAGIGTALGILAVLIAVIGLYSVISYSVSRRTREMGIRIALGAMKRDIFSMIIKQGLSLVTIGIAIGLIGAYATTRLIAGLLFGVGALDPITFIGVAVFFIAVALLACWIPARRAASTDPMTALRYE